MYGKDNRQYCFEKGGNTINYTCPEGYPPKDDPNVLGKIINGKIKDEVTQIITYKIVEFLTMELFI